MLLWHRSQTRLMVATAGTVAALCLTACGSTVQYRGTGQTTVADGLSADGGASADPGATDGTTDGSADAGTATTGTGGTGGTAGTTTTGGGTTATGGSTTTGGGKTTTGKGNTVAPAAGAPIYIGAEYVSESGLTTAAKAFGVDLDLGDLLAEEKDMVAYLNTQGGINNHPVKLVPYEDSTSDDASTNSQAACSAWTQDATVIAAITLAAQSSSCLAAKNVVELQAYNTANTPLASQLSSTPLLTIPDGLTLDRLASTYGTHMGDQGFFKSPANEKLGVVYNQTTNFESAYATMKSALSAQGIPVVSSYEVPAFTDASSAASLETAVGNAVLQFKAEGITHVMFLDNGTTAAVFFGMAAANQKYYPRYGLNGGDAASIFALDEANDTVMTANGTGNTQVLGYTPVYDTDAEADFETPQAKKCDAIYDAAGTQIPAGANPEAYALDICDSFLYLKAAFTSGGDDTSPAFLTGRANLAKSGYTDAMTFGSTASPDGVRTAQIAQYSSDCTCFAYIGTKIGL